MVALRVDAREIEELADRFIASNPVVARHLTVAMTRSTAQVQHDAMRLVPVDTGHLRRSITTNVTPTVGRVGTNVPYAPVVEMGRRPGARMPPLAPIAVWARRKGIPASAVYAIALAIHRRGIPARPYLGPALARNRNAINREFANELNKAVAELAA
jgi:phage gpG-like protein